jgi:hypothetical protein
MIDFQSDRNWTFWDFQYENESDPIDDWYQKLSEDAMFQLDALLKVNQKIELPTNWQGFRRFLSGKLRKERIWELGFVADKRQYRLMGIFGALRKHAIFLVGCFHKGRVYVPPDAMHLAYERARLIRAERASYRERKIENNI